MTQHFKIAGRSVELEQQWAVRINFRADETLRHPPGFSGTTQEKSLHCTKDEALHAICERMGEILDEERGFEKGSGQILVMGAIREVFEDE
jgi:hypothetical protein